MFANVSMIWLVLLVVFLLAEAACPVHLVSIWFAAGALVALIASALGGELWLQILLFILTSALLLAALWPFIRKVINPKLVATNVDALVGSVGIVTCPIDNVQAQGQVKLGGMEWTARSTSGAVIPSGARVKVDKIEGVKVYVTPVEVPAESAPGV